METCCAKSEEKGGTAEERKAERRKRRRWCREKRGDGGCEAAVKRGRVRVGPSQLAGRVDADRESKGWMDGRG